MCNNSMTKYIYGAGNYGKILLEYFQNIGLKIDYFVQTEVSEKKIINGLPVITINDIRDSKKGDKVIFLAISNEKIVKEIKNNINLRFERDSVKVYDYRKFIAENLLYKCGKVEEGEKECIICGEKFKEFLPAGIEENIFHDYHIIGGGYRENAICPCCRSLDRERWLFFILKNKLDIFEKEKTNRILHFAPEKRISELISEDEKIDYYTGDIDYGRAMHVTDITDIQYKDNIFDYVICNHVMEHIVAEEKAVSEIKRVLKPTGKWIFSFPICTDRKTYEDKAIITPSKRLEAYGQKDHVRLYGNDFVERFENYGFKIQVFSPKEELNDALVEKWGLIVDDIMIVASINE